MKIALIGATGFVGKEILNEAIKRNHEITAIARNITKITGKKVAQKFNLDVNHTEKLTNILKGHEIVISSFNPGWANPNIYEDYLKGARSIQEATKLGGVKRLFVIGGAGSLYLNERTRVIDHPEFPDAIKPAALAASEYLEVLKSEKDINWTFFSPAIGMEPRKPQIRTGKYRKGFDKPVFDRNGKSELSVKDAAIVIMDEIEMSRHINQRFTAAY